MPRFLHIADVHLGYDHYNSPERSRDFFLAFQDALERYALGNPAGPVDFVLVVGDLFEYRQILPATLNQAQICLQLLQDAGIPVLAIEGNHDDRPYGTSTSWLRYLAERELLYLLEPEDDNESLQPWDAETRRGGYLDLPCGVRVIGSRWYGASAPQAIAQLAPDIAQLPPGPTHTIMMFHHGLEGQVARYSGALRYQDLLPLHQAGVDYLALGHIHRNYTESGWIFNPGSIEANTVSENQQQNPRGVYLVTLGPERGIAGIQAELKTDYYQRPILRLQLTATPQQSVAELESAAIQKVKRHKQTTGAIVELRITGQVGFHRPDLDVRALQRRLHELSRALIFLLRYDVYSTQFDTTLPVTAETRSRSELEELVFTDQFAALDRYRSHAPAFAKGLMDLKDKILDNGTDPELYGIIQYLSQHVSSEQVSGEQVFSEQVSNNQSI